VTTSSGGGRDETDAQSRRGWIVTAALALLVAVVVASPVWRFRMDAGGAFRGIEFLGASDGEQYVTQLRKALDGSFGRANDILFEWSRGPQTYRLIGNELFLVPYRVVGGDLHAYVAWMTGVCAAAQFVLLYALSRRLELPRGAAHAVALACCLVPFVWSFHGHERWLFEPSRLQIDFLPLYRPINPSFTSLFLWGGLLTLLRWVERPNVVGWIAATALAAFGYDLYPPLYTMFGSLLAGAVVVLAIRRRWRDAAWLVAAGAIGVAANFRLLAGVTSATGGATQEVVEGNVNAVAFHGPILTADVATLLVVAAVAVVANLRRPLSAAALVVAVAAPVGLLLQFNQHLVTGRIYQPFHYDWMYSVPFLWLGLGALAPRICGPARAVGAWFSDARRRRAADLACAGAALLVVAAAFGGRATAPALRAVGVIRSDVVTRPLLLAAVGVGAAGAAWLMLRLLAAGRASAASACVCVAVGAASVVEGWRIQDRGYGRRLGEHLAFQNLAPAFEWLAAQGSRDAVVACGNGSLPRLFTSHVGCDVLVSLETIFYGSPGEDEYLDRRLLWLALYGVTREELAAELGDKGRWHFEIFKWRTFGPPPPKLAFLTYGVNPAPLPADAIANVLAKYDGVLALSPRERLSRYRLDYVLWTDLDGPDGPQGFRDPGAAYPLEVVVDGPGCRLYRVAPGR
jgi:hypothetical protein